MNPQASKWFLGAGVAVLITLLDPVAVQAQNTNTTVQDGRININRTFQSGDSNTNSTYQTGKININRTIQIGGDNDRPAGPFGRFKNQDLKPGKGLQRVIPFLPRARP